MPTYDYECSNAGCDYTAEVIQTIKEDHLTFCPKCSTDSLKRLIGRTSFVLNGSGWAKDNYGNSK